ncbi:MAG TPA: hypothetical protein VFC15_12535 [Candidatus Limnocylindrales bacterium]|nr:hypothetical protein [Candidatus Limnocylindrales bacterium]HZM11026.1 hypothetical protein [Candidatus Limnocylindrales bacterium]
MGRDTSNDVHVVLNHKFCFYGVAAIYKVRKTSRGTSVAEICGGIPPHIEALSKRVQNLQDIFSIQSKSAFLGHRSL